MPHDSTGMEVLAPFSIYAQTNWYDSHNALTDLEFLKNQSLSFKVHIFLKSEDILGLQQV